MFRSLRTKILAGFLLVIGIVLVIGAWGVVRLSQIQNSTSDALHSRYEILHAINTLDTATSHLRGAATRFLLTPGDTALSRDFARIEAASDAALSQVSTNSGPFTANPQLYRSLYQISHLDDTHSQRAALSIHAAGAFGYRRNHRGTSPSSRKQESNFRK